MTILFNDEEGYGSWANTTAPKSKPAPTNTVGGTVTYAPTGVDQEGYGAAAGIFGTAPVATQQQQSQTPTPVGGISATDLAAILAAFGASQNSAMQAQVNALIASNNQMMAAQNAASAAAAKAEEGRKVNAIENLSRMFEAYGLGSLAPAITDLVKQGYSDDTVTLMLQDTKEYKQRFAANEARRKAGISVLSPAEYLATERAYRQVMSAYGLPKGFYDQNDDFTDLLSKDVSASELQERVQNAADAVLGADEFYKKSLKDYYNMGTGDMIAFVLDAKRSLPIIQQRANAVSFGAAASRQGVSGVDVSTAEMFGGRGVTKQQSEQGFADIATMLPDAQRLGNIYKDTYGTTDALKEVFDQDATTAKKRRRLVQRETDTFSGSSGVQRGSLSQGTQGLL